jgi:predicted TPR repeat methyltransferase
MSIQQAYNQWAPQYDTNENKTRDLEALALKNTLGDKTFRNALEVGCGTGKNTVWLKTVCEQLTSIDLSEEMLAKAKEKIKDDRVTFIQADLLQPWNFAAGNQYDLIVFSLVLEHIENLAPVFEKLAHLLNEGGIVYVGELHPFKQYAGSKARFETEEGTTVVSCYTHNISDFTSEATRAGFNIVSINEYFDGENREGIPRILVLQFSK